MYQNDLKFDCFYELREAQLEDVRRVKAAAFGFEGACHITKKSLKVMKREE